MLCTCVDVLTRVHTGVARVLAACMYVHACACAVCLCAACMCVCTRNAYVACNVRVAARLTWARGRCFLTATRSSRKLVAGNRAAHRAPRPPAPSRPPRRPLCSAAWALSAAPLTATRPRAAWHRNLSVSRSPTGWAGGRAAGVATADPALEELGARAQTGSSAPGTWLVPPNCAVGSADSTQRQRPPPGWGGGTSTGPARTARPGAGSAEGRKHLVSGPQGPRGQSSKPGAGRAGRAQPEAERSRPPPGATGLPGPGGQRWRLARSHSSEGRARPEGGGLARVAAWSGRLGRSAGRPLPRAMAQATWSPGCSHGLHSPQDILTGSAAAGGF